MRPLLKPFSLDLLNRFSIKKLATAVRYAYNLDGVDDYIRLPFRAINPDGDNAFEFYAPSIPGGLQSIIMQTVSASGSNREFGLYFDSNLNGGTLIMNFGGAFNGLCNAAQGFETGKKYFLTLIGNTFTLAKGVQSNIIRSGAIAKGAVREPLAITCIGALPNGSGGFSSYFMGPQRDVKINGISWPMADRNQTVQLSEPRGLGGELITRSVLENPAVKGAQWSYLGGGRWQLIGDGNLSGLEFLTAASSPDQGYLEFEIESITGQITCNNDGVGGAVFSTVGPKRYFYVTKVNGGNNVGNAVNFKRFPAGSVVSCVIKNISFKPLGVFEPNILNAVTGRQIVGGTGGSFTGDTVTTTEANKIGRWSWPAGTFPINQLFRITFNATVAGTIDLCDTPTGNFPFLAGNNSVYLYRNPEKSDENTFRFLDIFLASAGSATLISVEKVLTLCNPAVMVNSTPERWVQV